METKKEAVSLTTNLFLLKPFSENGIQWRLFRGPWDILVEFYLCLMDQQILCALRPNEQHESEMIFFSNETDHLKKGIFPIQKALIRS